MDNLVRLSNVRVAGEPTFFPSDDPKKHRCLLTVIKNRGKNKAGQEMTDEIGLTFWGKYAQTAALYLDKGRAINVEGVLRSHTKDTGQVKDNGKKILHRNMTVHVKSFEFSADSKKELVKRVGQNIAKAKAEGLIPPQCTITPEYLIAVTRNVAYDYNPSSAAQTGRYGNARVYIKGQGFLGAGFVPAGAPAGTDRLAAMEQEIARLRQEKAAAAGAQLIADPFPQS
jgi:hypothetical protein